MAIVRMQFETKTCDRGDAKKSPAVQMLHLAGVVCSLLAFFLA